MKRISVYLKLRVIGAIDVQPGNTIISRIKQVATLTFHDEEGLPHVFTWRTIQTWLSLYKKDGVEALQTRPRSDKGATRKVSPEKLQAAIEKVLPQFREQRFNKMMVYRRCIEQGLICRGECSQTSFFRLVRDFDLFTPIQQTHNKRRLAFSKQYANEMWQMDTMFGPYMTVGKKGAGNRGDKTAKVNGRKINGGTAVQTKLIAFIDDASRVVTHGEFFLAENTDTLIIALRAALFKRGVPQTLYTDNGAVFTSHEINQICTRLGTLLCHTPVRDGAAKGKIERFFRTVRDQFLNRQLDLSSIEVLNRQFIDWVENDYHERTHGTLGMKPIDRFGLDLRRIRFLDPMDATDELFFFEQERTVRKDNTFSVNATRYEAPRDLASCVIHVRYRRGRHTGEEARRVIVYYKGERMGDAHLLDLLANDRPPRREPKSNAKSEIKPKAKKPKTPEKTTEDGGLQAPSKNPLS